LLAALEHHQRRDRPDPVFAGDSGVLVDVKLGDFHFAVHFSGDFFKRRSDHAAWPTPFGPKVDDDRLLWGGRITTDTREPPRLRELMRGDILSVYPQLGDEAVAQVIAAVRELA